MKRLFKTCLNLSLFCIAVVSAFSYQSTAIAAQYHLTGFKYQTCVANACIELSANEAWLSQVNAGFSADGSVRLRITDRSGSTLSSDAGTSATYHPITDEIMLDRTDGSVVLVSLKDGRLRSFGPSSTTLSETSSPNAKVRK